MATCVRCSKQVSGLGTFLGFDKNTNRCSKCEGEVRLACAQFRRYYLEYCQDGPLNDEEWGKLSSFPRNAHFDIVEAQATVRKEAFDFFRRYFLEKTQDGVLSDPEWATLIVFAQRSNLGLADVQNYIRGDALNLLERSLSFAAADGVITDEEEMDLLKLRRTVGLSDEVTKPFVDRLEKLKYITAIRRGKLPVVIPRAGTHLDSAEVCHFETVATYNKVNAKSVNLVEGRLLATNKKLCFLSPSGGVEIPWKNVMRLERTGGGIYVELSTKKGNGKYDMPDPLLAEAVIETIVRINKRQLLAYDEDNESRHIPHDVKIAVWQRDQGKCVQCSATSYLEFDHIIPHAKGGANTIANVQLLCRKCNLEKSDRI